MQRPRLIIPELHVREPSLRSAHALNSFQSSATFLTPTSAPAHASVRAQPCKPPALNLSLSPRSTANMSRFIAYIFKNVITSTPLATSTPSHMLHNSPPIYVDSLFKSLLLAFSIELPVLVLALFYLNRLCSQSATMHAVDTNKKVVLFCVCIGLAIKFTDDKATRSERWTKIIDVSASDANDAERYVLEEIGYNLYVNVEEYANYCGVIRALAKVWNLVASNSSPQRANIFNSPTTSTIMTPYARIPSMLRDIDERVSKRTAGNLYVQVSTPSTHAAFDYTPRATPISSRFPRFPHSIFTVDECEQ